MSKAELLTTAPTVDTADSPRGGSEDAQLAGGAARVGGGVFGAGGTVEDQLGRLEARLMAELEGDPLVEQQVRRLLTAAHARFAGATVRRFLPILIERHVRRQLDGLLGGPTSYAVGS